MCELAQSKDKLRIYENTEGLPGGRVIKATSDKLVDQLARDMMEFAKRRVFEAGEFHLALSGGSTPKVLFQHMVIDPDLRAFPWEQTHIWVVDERVVPFDDEKNNFKMMQEMLISNLPIPEAQVHPMPVMTDDGDEAYEADLRAALKGAAEDRLDYIILGMGPDGHTASLFPQTPGLNEIDRWVIFNDGERVMSPRPRMTMTYPLINNARQITVLLTGKGKFKMLKEIQAEEVDVQELPITAIQAEGDEGNLSWYMDASAALGYKPELKEDSLTSDNDPIELE